MIRSIGLAIVVAYASLRDHDFYLRLRLMSWSLHFHTLVAIALRFCTWSLVIRDPLEITKSDDARCRAIVSQVPQFQRGPHPGFPTIGRDRSAGSARTQGEP